MDVPSLFEKVAKSSMIKNVEEDLIKNPSLTISNEIQEKILSRIFDLVHVRLIASFLLTPMVISFLS